MSAPLRLLQQRCGIGVVVCGGGAEEEEEEEEEEAWQQGGGLPISKYRTNGEYHIEKASSLYDVSSY